MLAIYTRLSKDDPDSNSPKHQLNEGLLFFKKGGFKKYKHYDEGIGVSGGKSINERPALKEMVDDIEAGIVKQVWMRNQNRLERDTLTFHLFADIAANHKLDVYFGDNEKVDYNNPDSILQGSLLSAFNAYTRQKQGYNTKKSLRENLKKGMVHGVIPYGYTTDNNKKMIIDEEEAKVIKMIFEMSLNGNGYGAIATKLNELIVPTRYAKYIADKKNKTVYTKLKNNAIWDKGTIQGIIKNEVYKGIRTVAGETYEVEPIIKPFIFDRTIANLKNNMKSGEKLVEHQYLLNNVNVCGICGKPFTGRVLKNKNPLYRCVTKRFGKDCCGNQSVRLDVIDSIIWDNYFKNKYILKLFNTDYNKTMVSIQATHLYMEIEGDYETLENIITKKKNIVNLRASGELTAADTREALNDVEDEINTIKEVIYDKNQTYQALYDSLDDFISDTNDFENVANVEAFEDKLSLINKYIKSITITKRPKEDIFLHIDFIAPNLDPNKIIIDAFYNNYLFNDKRVKL